MIWVTRHQICALCLLFCIFQTVHPTKLQYEQRHFIQQAYNLQQRIRVRTRINLQRNASTPKVSRKRSDTSASKYYRDRQSKIISLPSFFLILILVLTFVCPCCFEPRTFKHQVRKSHHEFTAKQFLTQSKGRWSKQRFTRRRPTNFAHPQTEVTANSESRGVKNF